MAAPIFSVGQMVQPNDGHVATEVISIVSDTNGNHYTVQANWMDPVTEEVFTNAVRTYDESQLSAVE